MMVLLTAYLYEGLPPAGEDSEMTDLRIELMIVEFQASVFECSYKSEDPKALWQASLAICLRRVNEIGGVAKGAAIL